jgi:thymidylate synthase
MFAEAWWILSGDDRVSTIEPYSSQIAAFSDNGLTFNGAYGPQIMHQLPQIIETLHRSPESRQAVMTTWKPNPAKSKDIPCTISDQFLIRNNRLDVIHTMRSSDIWLGWPYDVFNFSMIAAYVVKALHQWLPTLELGDLYFNAGSQHLYRKNIASAQQCLSAPHAWDYKPLDITEFKDANDVLAYLEVMKDHEVKRTNINFLKDLIKSAK